MEYFRAQPSLGRTENTLSLIQIMGWRMILWNKKRWKTNCTDKEMTILTAYWITRAFRRYRRALWKEKVTPESKISVSSLLNKSSETAIQSFFPQDSLSTLKGNLLVETWTKNFFERWIRWKDHKMDSLDTELVKTNWVWKVVTNSSILPWVEVSSRSLKGLLQVQYNSIFSFTT